MPRTTPRLPGEEPPVAAGSAGAGIATAAASGCPFAPRCPLATARCAAERPVLGDDAHAVACHTPLGG